jgi:hypothetical protein
MSITVLSLADFFWIGFIVAVFGGGTSYFGKSKFDGLEAQIKELSEEVRKLRRDMP